MQSGSPRANYDLHAEGLGHKGGTKSHKPRGVDRYAENREYRHCCAALHKLPWARPECQSNLGPFSWVHPCGLQGVCVTSMKEIFGQEIAMDDARRATATHIQEIFDVQLIPKTLDDILPLFGSEISALDRKAYERQEA